MSLKEKLEAQQTNFRKGADAKILNIFDKTTNNLTKQHISNQALKKGDIAPHFSLPNATGETISSTSLLKDNDALVISFYRGTWCPYCNLEVNALKEILPQIHEYGAELITISPQTPDNSLSMKEKNALSFEVLSDENNNVAKKFGLVFKLPKELYELYIQFGVDLKDYNGNDTYELPMPATYIVNKKGEIIYSFISEDYTKRAEPSDILDCLKN
ncbi:peroxiredoxin-like family protein [Leptobacterium sp. I13]|uniref:peroxiredoxin-like family protein n=1 Tax=Leptobacterium meishanense TaxID=3128904 RepID=UPI0030EB3D19